ncbi:MAG: hypothetical protein GC154_14855 [bacterium]|nr:hypothetical protein [bacterium]
MKKLIGRLAAFIGIVLTIPAWFAGLAERLAKWVAAPRWHYIGFIPCSAGLWPLGLWCWRKEFNQRWPAYLLRPIGFVCLIVGTFLFFAGLWRFALLLLMVRLFFWIDEALNLNTPIGAESDREASGFSAHSFDGYSLILIVFFFAVLAINKERLVNQLEPSDHYYHMAVAQKILERGEIPLWDDWEFAPMGRPHLYPPFIHLLTAFFAHTPDHVVSGYATLQMLIYPLALFSHWLLYRRLLGAGLAYGSLIVLSMEFMFGMGCLSGLPSSLVNSFTPFILLAVLSKRKWLAAALLGLAFYTHTGMPMLISLGLLIFGVWRREYFITTLFAIAGGFCLAAPWLARYAAFSGWMHSGGPQGYSTEAIVGRLLWLQLINPVFVLLAAYGWIRMRNRNAAILRSMTLGFIPMLIQYGGRFFMHAAPFYSPFIAWPFRRWLTPETTRRRVLQLGLITLIPLPCISFFGEGQTRPGFMPNITATHFSIVMLLHRERQDLSHLEALWKEIEETTEPDDIIHLPDAGAHFADLVTVMTGRRTDMGGWGEVSTEAMWQAIQDERNDAARGLFVANARESIPDGFRVEKIDRWYIGLSRASLEKRKRGAEQPDTPVVDTGRAYNRYSNSILP